MPAVDWFRLRYCAYRFFFPRVSDYNRQATCRLAFIIIALWFNADENILSVISIAIFIFGTTINPKKNSRHVLPYLYWNTAIGMANQSFIFSNELCYFCRQQSIFTRLGEIVGRERWNHSPVNGEFRNSCTFAEILPLEPPPHILLT